MRTPKGDKDAILIRIGRSDSHLHFSRTRLYAPIYHLTFGFGANATFSGSLICRFGSLKSPGMQAWLPRSKPERQLRDILLHAPRDEPFLLLIADLNPFHNDNSEERCSHLVEARRRASALASPPAVCYHPILQAVERACRDLKVAI
jgi:hypothetical protein